jgi:hypothetical protein
LFDFGSIQLVKANNAQQSAKEVFENSSRELIKLQLLKKFFLWFWETWCRIAENYCTALLKFHLPVNFAAICCLLCRTDWL